MTRWPPLLALILLCACSPPPDGSDAGDMALADDAGVQEDGPGPGPARCSGRPTQAPGTSRRMIMSGGRPRSYLLHVPRSYDPALPTPVVFLFHGFGGSDQGILAGARMAEAADRRRVLVVAPQGIASSWNAGRCCGTAQQQGIDDVGLVRDLLGALRKELCIDDSRVLASGLSNGGFMSHRLGCELADQITGIAPVAGGVNVTRCAPRRPVSLVHFHARDDLIVPYAGGGLTGAEGAVQSWEGWAKRNGCTGTPKETYRMGRALCQAHETCAEGSTAILCSTDNGGHSWPGSAGGSRDIDATAQLLDLLLARPRP